MTRNQTIKQIAEEHLSLRTLKTRNSDNLDFRYQAVWNIKPALEAAYDAGVKVGKGRAR
jgi:hypothetical protein